MSILKFNYEFHKGTDIDVNCIDLKGCTPLYYACKNSIIEVIEILLFLNADVNIINADKNTALFEACNNNLTSIVSKLIDEGSQRNFQ